jgi:alpha-amylase
MSHLQRPVRRRSSAAAFVLKLGLAATWLTVLAGANPAAADPANGKVVLQAFYWDCLNTRYKTDPDGTGGWYTYLSKLAPQLRGMGIDGIWVPPPCKGNVGRRGMGYDLLDHYDIGQKFQAGAREQDHKTTGTRFGDMDAFLRMIAVCHANGIEVYPDIILNHMDGGAFDPNAWEPKKHKSFQHPGFAGAGRGRWAKGFMDFHPNPHHVALVDDDWRHDLVGVDICWRKPCCDTDCDNGGRYMRDQARSWFTWFKRQTDCDGFRFDAVKHFPPDVVEDVLFNAMDAGKPEADQRKYFAVGEFGGGKGDQAKLDDWASQTKNRAGTFDFSFRFALVEMIQSGGDFDMGSLPNFQQNNRLKTVPFVNNHDTWRGVFSDSSGNGKDDRTSNRGNDDEPFRPTIEPEDPRAGIAYAAAMTIDGSPQVYYEDLFDNDDVGVRDKADPGNPKLRDYLKRLIRLHQRLKFKDGAYKVPFQSSRDLLILERSGKALVAMNDHGTASVAPPDPIQTQFGPNVQLKDFMGTVPGPVATDAQGKLTVPPVPKMSVCVWGPADVDVDARLGGNTRRTTQEFQLDDDVGDNQPESLRYGGRLSADFRTAGAIWAAKDSIVKVWVTPGEVRETALRVLNPDPASGAKTDTAGRQDKQGTATRDAPLFLEFTAPSEGYYQLTAKLATAAAPVAARVRVEYAAPATSDMIK